MKQQYIFLIFLILLQLLQISYQQYAAGSETKPASYMINSQYQVFQDIIIFCGDHFESFTAPTYDISQQLKFTFDEPKQKKQIKNILDQTIIKRETPKNNTPNQLGGLQVKTFVNPVVQNTLLSLDQYSSLDNASIQAPWVTSEPINTIDMYNEIIDQGLTEDTYYNLMTTQANIVPTTTPNFVNSNEIHNKNNQTQIYLFCSNSFAVYDLVEIIQYQTIVCDQNMFIYDTSMDAYLTQTMDLKVQSICGIQTDTDLANDDQFNLDIIKYQELQSNILLNQQKEKLNQIKHQEILSGQQIDNCKDYNFQKKECNMCVGGYKVSSDGKECQITGINKIYYITAVFIQTILSVIIIYIFLKIIYVIKKILFKHQKQIQFEQEQQQIEEVVSEQDQINENDKSRYSNKSKKI